MSWFRRRPAGPVAPVGPPLTVGRPRAVDGDERAAPVLRATTSSDEVYDDPSEDALFLLFEDLDASGDYFIVVRLDEPTGEVYIQTMLTKDGRYLVERRAGSSATHEYAATADLRAAHHDMTSWAYAIDRPDVLTWRPGMP